jgi:phosphoenolpyruvate carboxykinase (GTP)
MLPFAGYNMSDYFQHWLNLGRKIAASPAELPKIYCVNWFRTDADGKFVWPGFGDNMRVLKWMLERIEDPQGVRVGGVPHIFGVSPRYEDLQWDGIDFTPEQFATITSIDKAAWAQEVELHTELFDKLKHNLPRELVEVKVALQKKLAA